MYKLYKHDDGTNLRDCSAVDVPEAFKIIQFRSKQELKFYDPRSIEFWRSGGKNIKKDEAPTLDLPLDPLSDENFQR